MNNKMKEKTEEEKKAPINVPVEDLDLSNADELDPNIDSKEEHYFAHWLKELTEAGAILDSDKNLMSIPLGDPVRHHVTKILKTKTKMTHRSLTSGYKYTPDFNCQWNPEWKDILFAKINQGKELAKQKVPFITCSGMLMGNTFEVKADFTQAGELQKTNMKILWLYEKNQYFVQMVRIPKLFEQTFTPQAYMDDNLYVIKSKRGKTKLKYKVVTCEEYLRKLKEDAQGQIPML